MSKLLLSEVPNGVSNTVTNTNFGKIEKELNDNTLKRRTEVGEDNTVHTDIDMNSNRIYNLPEPKSENEAVRLKEVKEVLDAIPLVKDIDNNVSRAESAANKASASESSAKQSELAAKQSAKEAAEIAIGNVPHNQLVERNAPNAHDASAISYENRNVGDAIDTLIHGVGAYNKIREYEGTGSRLKVQDPTGVHWWVRRGSAADNGGTVLVDALGRSWEREFSGSINVAWFFSSGSGGDRTDAINSAILACPARGSIYFPPGIHRVSDTIFINRSDITLYGDGNSSTYIVRTDGTYGDTIRVASENPNTEAISHVVIKDIRIQCNADMTNGAHLHLINVAASFFSDIVLRNVYRGIWLQGVRTSHFNSILILTGTHTTTVHSGSAYVYVDTPPTVELENTELFFNDFNWESLRQIENGVVIKECDGIWFSNGHIMGATNADCYLLSTTAPESDQILAAIFDNVWFDGYCDRNLQVSGNGPQFGLSKFTSCRFTGADNYNVLVSNSTMQGLSFMSCDFGVGTLDQSVDIFGGDNVSFNACRFELIDTDASNPSNSFINVRGTSTLKKLSVVGCTLVGYPRLHNGMRLLNAETEYHIAGNSFIGFEAASGEEIYTNQTSLKGKIEGNTTSRTFSVESASEMTVPVIATNIAISGGNGNISTIKPYWEGRELVIRAKDAAQNLVESGNIISQAGGPYELKQHRATKLVYYRDVGNWLQV